jgi:hypothetical protein
MYGLQAGSFRRPAAKPQIRSAGAPVTISPVTGSCRASRRLDGMPDDCPQLLRRAAARVAEVDLVMAAAGAVACFGDGLVQCHDRRRFGGDEPGRGGAG